ncbi:MAG: arginyltransferase [Cycloclasticus sp. symbiont of Bathymodiolus heckerae]|nr:MAG: arginyltransferase [Cycloclasticus sp. symbiont of Bathymodiolus heckerae]
MSSPGRQLALYISSPQPCDYLADQESQNIFISPDVKMTPGIYEYLISKGFRRSGQHTYRPHCSACHACISCRLDVRVFKPSRSQKRLTSKNKDLSFTPVSTQYTDEHFDLYRRYQAFKHPGGSMENFKAAEYNAFLCESFGNSLIYETRLGNQLLAVSVCDAFSNALSAVYTFFDPDFSSRSLGTYSVLQQIKAVQDAQKKHLYLGYYVQDSAKMTYKTNFRPIEMLVKSQWLSFEKEDTLPSQSSPLDSPLSF